MDINKLFLDIYNIENFDVLEINPIKISKNFDKEFNDIISTNSKKKDLIVETKNLKIEGNLEDYFNKVISFEYTQLNCDYFILNKFLHLLKIKIFLHNLINIVINQKLLISYHENPIDADKKKLKDLKDKFIQNILVNELFEEQIKVVKSKIEFIETSEFENSKQNLNNKFYFDNIIESKPIKSDNKKNEFLDIISKNTKELIIKEKHVKYNNHTEYNQSNNKTNYKNLKNIFNEIIDMDSSSKEIFCKDLEDLINNKLISTKKNIYFLFEKIVFFNNKLKFLLSLNKVKEREQKFIEKSKNTEIEKNIQKIKEELNHFGINYLENENNENKNFISNETLKQLFNEKKLIENYQDIIDKYEENKKNNLKLQNLLKLIQ